MQIYWIENNKRCGPATVPDILTKVQLGELSPETRGWHSGCAGWAPLRELPALADFLADKVSPAEAADSQPAPPEEPPPGKCATVSVILPGPMVRLLARLVDLSIYAALVLSVMYALGLPYSPMFNPYTPIFWMPSIVLEALLLSLFQTTPGKFWLGVRLHGIRGRISFPVALMRSILVFSLGMGCMLPLISVLTLVISYFNVKRRGVVVWDMSSATIPMLLNPPTRMRLFCITMFIMLAFRLCSYCMLPWLPDMMNNLRDQSPRTAEMLERYLPPNK